MTAYTACHAQDVWVQLTTDEIRYAVQVGRQMRQTSVTNGHAEKITVGEGMGERIQLLGAVAELAVAKALNIPWRDQDGRYKQADLLDDIEVKLIGVNHYGLRVYDTIPDHYRVVGVVIPRGKERDPYRIPGWIQAGDAKRDRWLMRPFGIGLSFYAVPQSQLRPLKELTL